MNSHPRFRIPQLHMQDFDFDLSHMRIPEAIKIPDGVRTGGFSKTHKNEEGQQLEWSYSDLVINWSENTTIHGIKYLTEKSDFTVRKIIWLLLVCVCMTLLLYQVQSRVQFYQGRPTSVTVESTKNDSLIFPTVTICNQNPFKMSAAAYAGIFQPLTEYISNPEEALSKIDSDSLDMSMKEWFTMASFDIETMLLECKWLNTDCDHTNFTTVYTDIGICYSFNSRDPLLKVTSTGSTNGLSILLNIQQYDYMAVPFGAAGIKFMTHSNNVIPSVNSIGQLASSGANTQAVLRAVMTHNLGQPFGKCEDKKLESISTYSESNCVLECRTKYYIRNCACRDYYMPEIGDFPVCTLRQHLKCIKKNAYKFTTDFIHKCNCTISCNDLSYEASLSFSSASSIEVSEKSGGAIMTKMRAHNLDARDVRHLVIDELFDNDKKLIEEFQMAEQNLVNILFVNVSRLLNYTDITFRKHYDNQENLINLKMELLSEQHSILQDNFISPFKEIDERSLSLVTHRLFDFEYTLDEYLREMQSSTDPAQKKQLKFLLDLAVETKRRTFQEARRKIKELRTCFENADPCYFRDRHSNYTYNQTQMIVPSESVKLSLKLDAKQEVLWREMMGDLDNLENTLSKIKNVGHLISNGTQYNREKWSQILKTFRTTSIKWSRYREHLLAVVFGNSMAKIDRAINHMSSLGTSFRNLFTSVRDDTNLLRSNINNVTDKITIINDIFNQTSTYLEGFLGNGRLHNETLRKSQLARFVIDQSHIIKDTIDILNQISDRFQYYANQWPDKLKKIHINHLKMLEFITNDLDAFQQYRLHKLPFADMNFTNASFILSAQLGATLQNFEVMRDFQSRVRALSNALTSLLQDYKNYWRESELDGSFLTKNLVRLNLYFREMNYLKVQQQKTYDLTALFSDIGGTIGLFVGGSFLSLMELLDLIGQLIYHRREKPKETSNGEGGSKGLKGKKGDVKSDKIGSESEIQTKLIDDELEAKIVAADEEIVAISMEEQKPQQQQQLMVSSFPDLNMIDSDNEATCV